MKPLIKQASIFINHGAFDAALQWSHLNLFSCDDFPEESMPAILLLLAAHNPVVSDDWIEMFDDPVWFINGFNEDTLYQYSKGKPLGHLRNLAKCLYAHGNCELVEFLIEKIRPSFWSESVDHYVWIAREFGEYFTCLKMLAKLREFVRPGGARTDVLASLMWIGQHLDPDLQNEITQTLKYHIDVCLEVLKKPDEYAFDQAFARVLVGVYLADHEDHLHGKAIEDLHKMGIDLQILLHDAGHRRAHLMEQLGV